MQQHYRKELKSNTEKTALRKHLLKKRDSTSYDLMEIHSKKIFSKLIKTKLISEAKSIGCYFSIGSEVQTIPIITHFLNEKKTVSLPKISGKEMTFRKIEGLEKLEKGEFDISEPRDNAVIEENHDIILVPSIGLDVDGNRIGYGQGFYDKFLKNSNSIKIALAFSKQIVKNIPTTEIDVKMDWIITEKDVIKVLQE